MTLKLMLVLTWCVEDEDEGLSFREDAENEERPLLLGESGKKVNKQSTFRLIHFHGNFLI